jgi:hypothetical protein
LTADGGRETADGGEIAMPGMIAEVAEAYKKAVTAGSTLAPGPCIMVIDAAGSPSSAVVRYRFQENNR